MSIATVALCALALVLGTSLAEGCLCNESSSCLPITTTRSREVFVFHLADSGGSNWEFYDWSIITTVAVFGDSRIDTGLYCRAHANGARVVLVAPHFDLSQLTSASARTAWAVSVAAQVAAASADGVNLDIEGADKYAQPAALTALTVEVVNRLRAANPYAQVTFDTSIYPLTHSTGYDYVGIAAAVDFLVP